MSAPAFTPGPWYVTGDDDLRYVREEASDAVLARIEDGGHVNPEFALSAAEQLANALLIAAAPDLYAAAEEGLVSALADIEEREHQLREWGDNREGPDRTLAVYRDRAAKIRAALAKARGEA